jgi:hypothetical protein
MICLLYNYYNVGHICNGDRKHCNLLGTPNYYNRITLEMYCNLLGSQNYYNYWADKTIIIE